MASDKFEVGDILVCEDGSAHGGYGEGLKVGKIYEVERPNGSGECYLVGNWHSWFSRRFRRATLAEIRKYRKEQGYYKHQFAIGELVVGIAQDSLLPVIGQTHVVSATKSDDEHECFIDIDGGKDPGQHFAAKFRKATPAEAAAYRKANEPPKEPPKAAPAAKNGAPADSIDSVEIGDEIVFVGPSNKNGREYGTIATVQGVIYKSGSKIHELRIHVPGDGWFYTTPDSWVPVGRGYELVAQGQPIHTGDEWLEAGRWNRTSFRTEMGHYKLFPGILRRKVKEDAVTVQIGNNPPFKAVGVNFDLSELPPISTFKPTFSLSLEWDGTVKPQQVKKKPVVPGNPAENTEESLNKAISFPKDFVLHSDDGREFEVIDWKPNVTMDEAVTVEAKLMVFQDPVKKEPKPEPKPKATPFKKGDLVVCTDSTGQHVAVADRIALGRTYRVESIDSMGFFRIEGMRGHWGTSRFRLAMVSEITHYWDKLGFPNHQFKVDDIVVCVDARPYDSTVNPDEVVEPEEGKAYKVEAVRGCDIKPSGCLNWNRVRFRLATPAEAQAFLDAEQASKKWEPKAGDIVVCIDLLNTSPFRKDLLVQDKTYRIERVGSLAGLKIEGVPEYWYTSRFRLATPAEAQAFLDAEKRPPSDPGIGYRFLDKEELVVEGDELWSQSAKKWFATPQWSEGADRAQWSNTTYRRRNQFAEGELVQIIKPATQALRDAYPKWVARGSENMDGLDGRVLECPPSRALSGGQRGINVELGRWWTVDVGWLAPASSKQKEAFLAEKAAKEAKKAKKAKADDLRKQIDALQAAVKDLEASS